jgi:hypothetical protein
MRLPWPVRHAGVRIREEHRQCTTRHSGFENQLPSRNRQPRSQSCHTVMRNCSRDEGGPFGFGDQEPIPSHRKLLSSKAMVVNLAETSGQ